MPFLRMSKAVLPSCVTNFYCVRIARLDARLTQQIFDHLELAEETGSHKRGLIRDVAIVELRTVLQEKFGRLQIAVGRRVVESRASKVVFAVSLDEVVLEQVLDELGLIVTDSHRQ